MFLEAPSPNGSLDGEESEGGAGAPQASSVEAGAEAKGLNKDKNKLNKTGKQQCANMFYGCIN